MIEPQLSSVLFRLNYPELTANRLDLLNQQVADELLKTGLANVGVTRFAQQTCLKLTILNPVITLSDLAQLLALVKQQATILLQPTGTPQVIRQQECM